MNRGRKDGREKEGTRPPSKEGGLGAQRGARLRSSFPRLRERKKKNVHLARG